LSLHPDGAARPETRGATTGTQNFKKLDALINMENQIKIKLKDFDVDIELKPLTIIIGKDLIEKSLLQHHLWASVATRDAVFLPASRICGFADARLIDKRWLRNLTESANLLLRDTGIELDIAIQWGKPVVYVKTLSGKRLELTHAPLGIRGVVAVVLALASDIRLIFIEEPEAHLHPSTQRLMARVIAETVNNGKFVVLSTHSDYIVSEFNNLIALSNVSKDVIKKLGYQDAEILKPESVAAYLVRAEGNRAVVERLEVDYTGIPEDEFVKVAEEILRIRNELY
jgi:ABC-type taurine transport system ATPase subunit